MKRQAAADGPSRLQAILEATRQRIQEGKGIPEEAFREEVESGEQTKRGERKRQQRPSPGTSPRKGR
jgi:hypothetical protein